MVKMSIEAEGWHMDAGPPSWDPEAKTFSFFLHKRGRESVLCIVAMDALENAAQRLTENELSDFSRLWHDGCGEAIIEAQDVDRNHSRKV
jgi:hypothetical protein